LKVVRILLALLLTFITLDALVACAQGRTRDVVVGNLLLAWVSGWYAVLTWRRLWLARLSGSEPTVAAPTMAVSD
jgi:hypothetical protein